MSTSTPLVSVAMGLYNAGRFFRPAIESLLSQTLTDFELVIVNDGSTDGSGDLAEQYAARDSRVRVLHQENQGISTTANRACRACTGKYLARMDSDDVAHPERLARQVEFLEKPENHDVVCVGTFIEFIDGQDRRIKVMPSPTSDSDIQDALLRGHCSIWQTSAMMRREVWEQSGGYDPEFASAEDIHLWLRLGEVGRLANLPLGLMQYRLHESSISQTKGDIQKQRAERACREAAERRGIENRYEVGELWRPTPDGKSQSKFACRYGWWAFNAGHLDTARAYGLKAVRHNPLSSDAWRLLLCMLRPSAKSNSTSKPAFAHPLATAGGDA